LRRSCAAQLRKPIDPDVLNGLPRSIVLDIAKVA
jgi:hypothetical protein